MSSLRKHLDRDGAAVPWSRAAAVLTINRLCGPGSELAVEQHWYPSTALDDLLPIGDGKINDTRLYCYSLTVDQPAILPRRWSSPLNGIVC
jgi:hypothetical protein